jgi:ankyrin repeat protein
MDEKQLAMEIRAAIKQGDTDKVAALIGSSTEWRDMMTPFGTWLHVAAAHGQLDIVKLLVSLGANVNIQGGILGGSPLNEAASEGHLDIVKYLFACGAELDVSDPRYNPLFGAIYGGYTDVAKFLIDCGIDTDVKYTGEHMNEMDALAFAREWGRTEIIDLLTSSQKK